MSNIIDLKKGLNIPISGVAALEAKKTIVPDTVAIKPTDFKGFSPRLLVKEGDKVLAGSPVLADKQHQDILLTSPVSGTVQGIVRGEKRKLLAVLVKADGANEAVDFGAKNRFRSEGRGGEGHPSQERSVAIHHSEALWNHRRSGFDT